MCRYDQIELKETIVLSPLFSQDIEMNQIQPHSQDVQMNQTEPKYSQLYLLNEPYSGTLAVHTICLLMRVTSKFGVSNQTT